MVVQHVADFCDAGGELLLEGSGGVAHRRGALREAGRVVRRLDTWVSLPAGTAAVQGAAASFLLSSSESAWLRKLSALSSFKLVIQRHRKVKKRIHERRHGPANVRKDKSSPGRGFFGARGETHPRGFEAWPRKPSSGMPARCLPPNTSPDSSSPEFRLDPPIYLSYT